LTTCRLKIQVRKKYSGNNTASRKEKIYQTTITLRRYGQARPGPGFSLKLKVEFEDGTIEWREWDAQGRWARFYFEKPARVKTAVLDPEAICWWTAIFLTTAMTGKGQGPNF